MMNPKLDPRTVKDILARIRQKSEFYTPEWRYDPENPDAGGALAQIFAEMFFETIDRYNRFPDKCYLEFLNMQGVCAKSVSPAVGMAAAQLVDGAAGGVLIPKDTQLFTDLSDSEGNDRRVVFETSHPFVATPAKPEALYMTDPVRDIITCTEISDANAFPLKMFSPKQEDNLERHRFCLSHDAILKLKHRGEIRVKSLRSGMSFRISEDVARLIDPNFAQWSCTDGVTTHALKAERDGDIIVLTKEEVYPIVTTDEDGVTMEEDGHLWLFCDMKAAPEAEQILADSLMLSVRSVGDEKPGGGNLPEHLFANDTELDQRTCGYCFGREPSVYDSLYICCDEAFSKRGAEIALEFAVSPIIIQDNEVSEGEDIDFNSKLVIDKNDAQMLPYDDIYISEIVWEYWNGFGWARLEVFGDLNPFSCMEQGEWKHIRFTCPEDMLPSVQNAYEGYWLRARIRRMENRFSTRARWLVPLLKHVGIRFDYGEVFLPAELVCTNNHCTKRMYRPLGTKMEMELFSLMPEQHHAVYLRFDQMPNGYPVNLYFDLIGSTSEERVIVFEYLCGDLSGRTNWCEIKTIDRTRGFENSGIVSLYLPGDFLQAELFGESGFWIRAVNRTMRFHPDCEIFPKLAGIVQNAVEIVQKQSVKAEMHEVVAGKSHQRISLTNRPIIDCAVWVNELPETPLTKLREIAQQERTRVRQVTDSTGALTEFWVRWEARTSLADCAEEDRCCRLDATEGVISFGDGIQGRIPAYHTNLQVSVDYSFGGGAAGNLPAGKLDGLIVSIPYVDQMTNIVATCGGSDEQSIETVRKIGTKRLKHYGRAVTAEDFESLVLEEFNEVTEVRCFTNRDRHSQSRGGYVTVVIVPHDLRNVSYTASLCRRVEEFLMERAGCELVIGKRLCVIPAVPMRVNAEVSVQLDDYDHAAQIELDIISTVSNLLCGRKNTDRIGILPRVGDVIAALKKLEHISYINRVLLVGEYTLDNELITVALDGEIDYRYFVVTDGTHTVKI